MSSAYWTQPISAQVSAVNSGRVSSESLVVQVRDEIERREADLSAWVDLVRDHADVARAQDHVGTSLPMRGISLGVKDLIDVAGMATRAGSVITSSAPVDADADCVSRFRELGAIIQGKTVTTEFGYFAPGPTRNPHAPDHTPGGSSSGSAAAVGAGVVPVALGTQTAGSLTRPAAFCGTAGMVLAQGATSLAGITGLSESLDSLGILTRTSVDLHYAYTAFAGAPTRTVAPARTALVWDGSELGTLHPTMTRLLQIVPDLLRKIDVEPATLDWDDHVRTLADDHVTVMSKEAAATLRAVYDEKADQLSPQLRELVSDGQRVQADAHKAALVRRDRSRAELDQRLGMDTIIVGPAALGPAPRGLTATGSPVLSRPWQLLGSPVVVVPGLRTEEGLPLGLQLIAQPGREDVLLQTAIRLERVLRATPAIQEQE
ncbi:amidase [Gordonia sp. PKS22-38]|uniref:Amidase n=1 Tax=Gordonia prachuapensis TaxID=3115651 RepID=A0ABU7MNV8_9ACTN|nr:amidase [Gordonia sp. PKS22-38]